MTSSPFLAALSLLVVSALVSCGGSSRRDGDADAGGSGGSSAGNAGRGGSTSSGSGGGGAGSSTGGTGSSTGGAGGEPSSICSLPAVTGNCNAAIRRFFHDAVSGLCQPFTYGGCGGNENNFDTFEACEAECGSKPIDTCTESQECVLRSPGCCGACEPTEISDFVAINSKHDRDYDTLKGCGGVACGACPEPTPGETTSSYFVPTCDAGRCRVLDLRTTEITACDSVADCSLRIGSNCCEGCSSTGLDLIALGDEAALSELVCPSEPVACPPCEPIDPGGFAASCEENRCVVTAVAP